MDYSFKIKDVAEGRICFKVSGAIKLWHNPKEYSALCEFIANLPISQNTSLYAIMDAEVLCFTTDIYSLDTLIKFKHALSNLTIVGKIITEIIQLRERYFLKNINLMDLAPEDIPTIKVEFK